uniref:Uncharacterized mitochondrial protein AtMg00810-like n=1 Tax=Tanacetum cinerariifolium TaxID=118510 RepID=A0A6L2NPS8_TANCI|nr:uncharacterized mitochondrial protein AtMg00810-like [Tanacetum cinerariifolium]
MQTQTSNNLHNAIMEAGGKDRLPMLASDSEGSLETTTERYMENYKNVSQDIRDQLNAEAKVIQIILTGIDNDIYSIVDACPKACEMWKAIERLKQDESINIQDLETNLYWEFGKFTSRDGESLESYNSRLYKIMNELVRNQYSRAEIVSYHKLYDIMKQHQNKVNELRAERLARTANPLALVAQQQLIYHPLNHPTHYTQNSSTRSQQAATRNRGKAIVNSPPPIHDQEPSMVAEDDEMSKDKKIDKLMALISLSFKKIYKPTNNNLRTTSNTSRANEDNSPRINKRNGYENQRIGNVIGARETVEQADWRDDTDEEFEDQELEAHYMYMAQIQEVTPDAADDFGPIFNTEPLQKIDQNDDDDDLANERDLLASLIEKLKCEIEDFKTKNKTLESSNNHFKEANNELSETNQLMYKDLKKFQAELDRRNDVKYVSKIEIDCAKAKGDLISYKMESQKSFNTYTQKINDLNQMISKMKKVLSAHQETISILSQLKEAQIKLYKTHEDKELDKVIALENKFKVLDNIVYKTGQSVQTINMLNSKCKTSFAKPKFLKKAQRANPLLINAGLEQFHLCLKEEMIADLRYFNSLKLEVDSLRTQLETQKTQCLNEIDRLLREYYYADHMNAILGVYTELGEVTYLQCDYLETLEKCECLEKELSKKKIKNDKSFQENQSKDFCKEREQYFEIQDLKTQLQDNEIAISELKKLIEMLIGKYVDTKFEKSSVIRQSKAFKSQRQSILGKATILSASIERKDFSKSKPVTKNNASNDFSKPVTAQILPPNTKSILKNINVLAPGIYKIHTKPIQTRTSQLPYDFRRTNKRMSFSTRVIPPTNVSRPQLKSNPIEDRVMLNNSQGKKHLNAKTTNVNFVCATCGKCMLNGKHDMCVLKSRNGVNSMTKIPIAMPISSREPKRILVEIILFVFDSGCSKHMTGNLKLLINFVEKFLGMVKFRNDQIAPILGYGDLVQGAVTIKRVYYVEGLNHNLFFVSQFYDADLEVVFWKSTCYIRDLKGNDLLTGSRGTYLYSITLQDTSSPNPICLMAKATSDGENLDKIKEKGDACIFVGYSTQSRAYRVFNKRTRVIVETIHVNFNELPQMASDHVSSDPVPQCQSTTLEQDSLSPGPQYHPLEQVIGNPSQSVRTRLQLESDGEMCMFALIVSRTKPKNIKESMADSAWIESMQEELHQFDRLDVWELVDRPVCKNVINIKWLWNNKRDEENTVIRNKSRLVAKGYAKKGRSELKFFLGIQIHQSPRGIFIYQAKYAQEILIKHVGALAYLTACRPDIVHAICYCARYQAKPTEKHLTAVKRIFWYLKDTINMGLWYPKDTGFELTTFSDSDHSGCLDSRKSTSGGIQFLGGDKLVSWSSKKQDCTLMSSAEAK